MKKSPDTGEGSLSEREKQERKAMSKVAGHESLHSKSDLIIPTDSPEKTELGVPQQGTLSSDTEEAPARIVLGTENDLETPDPAQVLSDAAKKEVEESLKVVEVAVEGVTHEVEQLASDTTEAVRETFAEKEGSERTINPLEPLKAVGEGFRELFELDSKTDQMMLDLFGITIENRALKKVVSSAIVLGGAVIMGGILYFEWWLVSGIFF